MQTQQRCNDAAKTLHKQIAFPMLSNFLECSEQVAAVMMRNLKATDATENKKSRSQDVEECSSVGSKLPPTLTISAPSRPPCICASTNFCIYELYFRIRVSQLLLSPSLTEQI